MKTEGLVLLISTILFSSCQKQYELATVIINSVDYITHTSAIAKCNVTDDGGVLIVEKGVCWSEKSPATVQDNYSNRGIQDTGKYVSPLFNLKPGTIYYVRAYAKNLKGISYSEEIQIKTLVPEYLTDSRDNQKYAVVKIGNQYWMAENLNYYTNEGSWYYNNDSISFSKFGRLYNWYIACNVCPKGWRLPTREDWNELIKYINNNSFTGFGDSVCKDLNAHKLKLPGTGFWEYEKNSINNETGFSAIAAGVYVVENDNFSDIGVNSAYWSSDEYNTNSAWFYRLESYSNSICNNFGNKGSGLSVRCIKNE